MTTKEALERETVCANCKSKLYQTVDPNNVHWYHEGTGDVRCPTRFAKPASTPIAPVVDEPLLPQTDYKTKPQLDGKERYKFGHLFHEYTFNNCDHGEQSGRVCKGCVLECLAYLAQRPAPASTVAPQP